MHKNQKCTENIYAKYTKRKTPKYERNPTKKNMKNQKLNEALCMQISHK